MTCGIYKIEHISGKCYVGQSVNIERRWRTHRHLFRYSKHEARQMQRTYDRDGAASLRFIILEVCAYEELTAREQWWMDNLKPVYNVAPAAGSQLGLRWKNTPETIEKRAAKLRGYKHSPETIANMSAVRKGRPLTEAHKAAIRANANRVFSPEHRAKISAAQKARHAAGVYEHCRKAV